MIEVMTDLPEHVLGFTAHGTVSGSDYDSVLLPELQARFRQHDRLSLLYHFAPDFSGFSAKAIWDDTWADLGHFRSWDRIAVVTDVDWVGHLARLFALMRPGHARVFSNAELDEARRWVSGP